MSKLIYANTFLPDRRKVFCLTVNVSLIINEYTQGYLLKPKYIGHKMKDIQGRRDRKKKTTRDAIFRIAQKLFEEKGFENTSVEDITNLVDIAQSTFFNYFPRKEDILVELFRKKLPLLKKKCYEVLNSKEDIKTKIHKIFISTSKIAARNEKITRAVLIKTLSAPTDRQYDEVFFDDFRKTLALVLKKGQEEGVLRRDMATIKLANMLEGVFTLFVIDCLIRKTYKMSSSNELFKRLDICLEGMLAGHR